MTNAELRDIPEYAGRYAVSREGHVWSHPKAPLHDGKWLAPAKKVGYPIVCLVNAAGRRRMRYMHQLVAAAWLPNPERLPEINHKDSDRANPHVDNLEWCTRSENVRHSYREGHKTARAAIQAGRLASIRAAIASGEKGKEIARRHGVLPSTVSGIKNGLLYAHQPRRA